MVSELRHLTTHHQRSAMSSFASLINSYKKENAVQSAVNSSGLSNRTAETGGEGSGCAPDHGIPTVSGLIISDDGTVGCFSHKQTDFLPMKVHLSGIRSLRRVCVPIRGLSGPAV